MNVLYLTWAYPSAIAPHAAPFFRSQAEALARLGAKVRVVAPTPWVPPLLEYLTRRWSDYRRTPSCLHSAGVRVEWPRYPVMRLAAQIGITHRFVRSVIERAIRSSSGVVHAHGAYPLGFTSIAAARPYARPTVLTLHGGAVNVLPLLSPRHRRQFEVAVRGATRVLAVSAALADRTERMTGIRPTVLPIGIDASRFSTQGLPDRATLRRRLGLPVEAKLMLYVGNLIPTKGIAELCQALRALEGQNAQCVFIGDGPLRQMVQRTPNAIYAGRVANGAVRDYMAACDVLVLPSYTEGLPTVVVEAGMTGLPVIASEVGGIPELLAGGRGLLIPAKDVRALIEAVRFALEHGDEMTAMAARLQRHVRAEYDARINAQRLLSIYADVMAGSTELN